MASGLRDGSCGGGTATRVYRFTPNQDGEYLFTVTGAANDAEPILYLRHQCNFDETPYQGELACNADAPVDLVSDDRERAAAILHPLSANESVYVFVDSSGRAGVPRWAGPYALSVSPANPPEITSGHVVFERVGGRVGVFAQGQDLDFDRIVLRFFNHRDQPIPFDDEQVDWALGSVTQVVTEEGFTLYGLIEAPDDVRLNAVRSVHLVALDALGRESMPFVSLFADPVERPTNALCDPNQLVHRCSVEGDTCQGEPLPRCDPSGDPKPPPMQD